MKALAPASKLRADIVVVGGANTDFLVRGPRLPQAGETVQGDTFDHADAGGKGANQAVAAARLGAGVAFIGRVGADPRGKALRAQLKVEGVDTRHVAIDRRAATGVALINVDADGEKQILVAPGANLRLSARDVQRAAKLIAAARVLILQLEVPISANVAAARIARRAGVAVVLDPAPALDRVPAELLRLVTVIRPNEHEAEALTGVKVRDRKTARAAAERLLDRGIQTAIVAAGKGNLLVARETNGRCLEKWLPKLPVKAIDATGAGDAFAAAFAVALAEGQSMPDAAVFANAAAALCTTVIGAQAAMPKRAAVISLLRRAGRRTEAGIFSAKRGM